MLQEIAEALARYANSIEKYLAKDQSIDKSPIFDISVNTAPEHWLEKVRQGAPHLLSEDEPENQYDSFPTELIKTADLQLNSSNIRQESKLDNKPVTKKSFLTRIHKSAFNSVRKVIYESLVHTQFNKLTKEENTPSTDSIISTKRSIPFVTNISSKKINKLSAITDSKTITPTKVFYQSYKSNSDNTIKNKLSFNNIENKTKYTSNQPKQTNQVKQSKKTIEQSTIVLKSAHKKSSTDRHYYSKPKIKINTTPTQITFTQNKKVTENDLLISSTRKDSNILASGLQLKNKKTNKLLLKEALANKANKANKAILSDRYKQDTTTPKSFKKKNEAYSNNSFKLEFSSDTLVDSNKTNNTAAKLKNWPNLPNELLIETDHDNWPQLPKQEQGLYKDGTNQKLEFWQLHKQEQYKSQKDQEQRGTFWNA